MIDSKMIDRKMIDSKVIDRLRELGQKAKELLPGVNAHVQISLCRDEARQPQISVNLVNVTDRKK